MILEFFIAFFGIIYFVTRMGGEKVAANEAGKKQSTTASAYKLWSKVHTDSDLERELREMVEDSGRYNEVWAIVKDDYAQMPSQSHLDSVPITFFMNTKAYPYLTQKQRLAHLHEDRNDVLRLLMARHGKILMAESIGHIAATQPGARVDPAAHRFCEKQYDYMVRLSRVSEDHNGPRVVFHALADEKDHKLSEKMHERSIGEYYWENPFHSL